MHTEPCRLWLRSMWQPPSTACSCTRQHISQWNSSSLDWKASVHSQFCLCVTQSTGTCTGTLSCGCIGAHCCCRLHCNISAEHFYCLMHTPADCTTHAWEQPQAFLRLKNAHADIAADAAIINFSGHAMHWVSSQAHSSSRLYSA